MSKEFWIGRDKSPSSIFKICCHKLNNNNNNLTLVALEGAIIVAIDAVNMLVRENIVTINKIETSLIELKSRNTNTLKKRSKISISISKVCS